MGPADFGPSDIYWLCPSCHAIEITSPDVPELSHWHPIPAWEPQRVLVTLKSFDSWEEAANAGAWDQETRAAADRRARIAAARHLRSVK